MNVVVIWGVQTFHLLINNFDPIVLRFLAKHARLKALATLAVTTPGIISTRSDSDRGLHLHL